MRPEGPLPIKYRPQDFDEVIGQDDTVNALKAILTGDRERPHSYLLYGPRGTGKTTLALIIRKYLNCDEEMDLRLINAANNRGIDTIREVVGLTKYAPIADSKIFFFDEAHQLTSHAQESLLKETEDAPSYCYFIFSTTEPDKLIGTLRSRCTTFKLNKVSQRDMVRKIVWVMTKEGFNKEDQDYFNDVIWKIAKISDGSVREALVMLDTCISLAELKPAMEFLENYVPFSDTAINELCQKLMAPGPWEEVATLLKKLKGEPEKIRRGILGYFDKVMLNTVDPRRISAMMSYFRQPLYDTGKPGLDLACCFAKLHGK